MNYYEHHLGDYAQATAHLSMLEDASYSRLLRWYYAEERPLPGDVKAVQRIARAQSKQERDAVAAVLSDFFVLTPDGYRQARADKEIARYQDKQQKAKRSANARWNPTGTHSEGNANASPDAMRTHSEGNAHQTPDTRHHTVVIESSGNTQEHLSEQECDPRPHTPAGAVCRRMIELGIEPTTCNPGNQTLAVLLGAGAGVSEFEGAARSAVVKGKPDFKYALGIVKKQREDAAKLVLHHGRLPNKQEALENSNRAVAARWVPPELKNQEAKED